MKTISAKLKIVDGVLGTQVSSFGQKYKKFLYVKSCQIADGTLLYNLLTRELLLLSDDEYESYLSDKSGLVKDRLIEKWFYIPDYADDKTMFYMFRQGYEKQNPRKRFGKLELATIFTTLECNARCPYCYEHGVEKLRMSDKVAEDAAYYLLSHKTSNGKIHLKWFGGEPLFNSDAINLICSKMKENGANYESSIVSNGYLFNEHPREEIVGLWNLKMVQITLDGTGDEYNRIKNFIYQNSNAFSRVTGNIEYLADMGITVHVRLNLSMDNAGDMESLIGYLKLRFGNRKNVVVYIHPLFEDVGNPPLILSDEQRNQIYDDYIQLRNMIAEYGLGSRPAIQEIRRTHCMADNGRSICILPDGRTSLCEHHADDEILGSIYSEKQDKDVLDRWSEKSDDVPECALCFYYPQCLRLKLCPTDEKCTNANRKFREHQVIAAITSEYEKWKASRSR